MQTLAYDLMSSPATDTGGIQTRETNREEILSRVESNLTRLELLERHEPWSSVLELIEDVHIARLQGGGFILGIYQVQILFTDSFGVENREYYVDSDSSSDILFLDKLKEQFSKELPEKLQGASNFRVVFILE